MTVIGLCGFARSGKSTVAQILGSQFGFAAISFADTLKSMALAIDPLIGGAGFGTGRAWTRLAALVDEHGMEGAKDHAVFGAEVRRFLQRLGTEGVRQHLGLDTWVDAWSAKVRKLGPDANVATPDVRFENEARVILDAGGEVWRVVREGFGPVNGHVSDAGLPDELVSRTINNSGVFAELWDEVRACMVDLDNARIVVL